MGHGYNWPILQEVKMKPIDEIYPLPDSTQQETNVNTKQDMTNSEGRAHCLQKQSPEKDPWADLLAGLRENCEKENMTDMDALCAWRMGIEAYKAFRTQGGTL
jgi:hypothetical protein